LRAEELKSSGGNAKPDHTVVAFPRPLKPTTQEKRQQISSEPI